MKTEATPLDGRYRMHPRLVPILYLLLPLFVWLRYLDARAWHTLSVESDRLDAMVTKVERRVAAMESDLRQSESGTHAPPVEQSKPAKAAGTTAHK